MCKRLTREVEEAKEDEVEETEEDTADTEVDEEFRAEDLRRRVREANEASEEAAGRNRERRALEAECT